MKNSNAKIQAPQPSPNLPETPGDGPILSAQLSHYLPDCGEENQAAGRTKDQLRTCKTERIPGAEDPKKQNLE